MKHIDNYNIHHLAWPRANFKNSVERAYRNHPALQVMTNIDIHNDLHAEMGAPQMPTKNQMLGAIALLNQLDYRHNQLGALDVLAWHYREQDDNTARSIGKHLHHQIDKYLTQGIYRGENKA